MDDACVFQVCFTVDADLTDALETWLALEALSASSWHEAASARTRVAIYVGTPEEATALLETLPERLHAADLESTGYTIEELGNIDWLNAWKRFFHAERISPRILVHPSWEPTEPPVGVHTIEIDPGMSFGTGLHGTTRACIRMLDSLQTAGVSGRLLDVGCGSGILALAALRLGFSPVEAFDLDPQAIEDTRVNLARNGLTAAVHTADATNPPAGPPCEVIVANILAPILHTALPALLGRLRPGGYLILSGILTSQFDAIRARATALGLEPYATLALDEWTSGCFRMQKPKKSRQTRHPA